MSNLTETAVWAPGVFQLETTTPVLGGPEGPSNTPLLNLANRTAYLKAHVDTLEEALPTKAPLNSPDFTGSAMAVTPADGDSTRRLATTEWVQGLIRGQTTKNIAAGNTALTAIEAGKSAIILTGNLTGDATVSVPAANGRWTVTNRTTGGFTVTFRAAGGGGVLLAQGKSQQVWCDGTDMLPTTTEARNLSLTGTPTAPTAPAGTATTQLATTAFARQWGRGRAEIDVSAGGTITPADTALTGPIISLTGSPGAATTLILPGEAADWILLNGSTQTVTVRTAGQSGGVAVTSGRSRLIWTDGSSVAGSPTELEGVALRGTSTAVTPSPSANNTELVTTEWVRALLAGQAVYTTGDTKLTLKAAADPGWLMLTGGTIGNAASSGTARANADTADLFTLLWNNLADAQAPVVGGRGASAAADFTAGKRITLPDMRGRAVVGAGQGTGLTARALGSTFGTETHVLTYAQMPQHDHGAETGAAGAHDHTVTVSEGGGHAHDASTGSAGTHVHSAACSQDGDHWHTDGHEGMYDMHGGGILIGPRNWNYSPVSGIYYDVYQWSRTSTAGKHAHQITLGNAGAHTHSITVSVGGVHAHTATVSAAPAHRHTIAAAGGNEAHPNVQPSIALNVMVKL
ncbi:hypothetical protein EOD42_22365 [Rhodovarius crocodyli]|uniref:Tail fiber protein n=1 Tax=Rhodovarius crocodyli TaxID=1979269 RepID=A0A437M1B9_9PROT|nr:hypothetical protein [Rhodovarius crocodyli]RVT91402.1 hypothetical protein EOD42_22365 [Rhodovarius crocodyli]